MTTPTSCFASVEFWAQTNWRVTLRNTTSSWDDTSRGSSAVIHGSLGHPSSHHELSPSRQHLLSTFATSCYGMITRNGRLREMRWRIHTSRKCGHWRHARELPPREIQRVCVFWGV